MSIDPNKAYVQWQFYFGCLVHWCPLMSIGEYEIYTWYLDDKKSASCWDPLMHWLLSPFRGHLPVACHHWNSEFPFGRCGGFLYTNHLCWCVVRSWSWLIPLKFPQYETTSRNREWYKGRNPGLAADLHLRPRRHLHLLAIFAWSQTSNWTLDAWWITQKKTV